MNTIKMYLTPSGSIAELKKDFQLYQWQYQNKLLNVFVPTSIIAPSFTSQSSSGTTLADYVASTSVKIGMTYTARDGSIKTSKSYFMRYLKTLTYQNIEYALYERMLPQEFTFYAGQGENAPTLIANVVNILNEPLLSGSISVGENLSNLTINSSIWQSEISTSGNYSFVYSSEQFSWQLNTQNVQLSTYGISVSGTPNDNDIIVINYVSAPVVLSTITSQTCSLDVMASSNLYNDTPIEPSDLEIINAQINEINDNLALKQNITDYSLNTESKIIPDAINEVDANKQDKNDNSLTTTEKNIVGAINENKGKIDVLGSQVEDNTQNIASNETRISFLEQNVSTGENYVGQIKQETLPTTEELNEYVQQVEGRPPQSGDVIIVIQTITGATDKNFKYTYGASGWESYEIPAQEPSNNNVLGTVKGTYNIGSTNNTQFNIVGGEPKNIYIKDGTLYRDLYEFVQSNKSGIATNTNSILNIQNGTTPVGNALKLNGKLENSLSVENSSKLNNKNESQLNVNQSQSAINDGLGQNINDTYMTQVDGATKAYVQEYALPKEFNDIYYYSSSGFVDEVPTTPPDGVQFSVTTNSVGSTTLANVLGTINSTYTLTSKNTASNTLWISADRDCVAQIRLTTSYKKAGSENWTDLAIELTDELEFSANQIKSINIFSIFNLLGGLKFNAENGDERRQIVEIVTNESTTTNWSLYCNQARTSLFYLNAQAVEITVNTIGGAKLVVVNDTDFVLNPTTGLYEATITQVEHGQPVRQDYDVWARIDNAGAKDSIYVQNSIDAGGNITISVETPQTLDVYIASERETTAMGILSLINPTALTGIDFNSTGTIKIVQNTANTPLTLEAPSQANTSYSVFVYNDKSSTENIIVNDQTLTPDSGIKFNWVGEWQVGEMPDTTSEIYDSVNNQPLDTTLAGLRTDINKNTNDIADINTMIARELKVVGRVDFNQNGTTPIQTITDITSGNLIPIDLSTAVIDVSKAPSQADGTVQTSWLGTPYNSGATPQNLVFYSSSMPIRANATGSVLLVNPIVGQNTKVNVVLSYTKATNTSLTMGIVVLNTTTGEVVRYPQLSTITNVNAGSVEYPSINLTYNANDKYVLFVQPTYSGGSLTNVSINKVTLTTDFYPLNKGE